MKRVIGVLCFALFGSLSANVSAMGEGGSFLTCTQGNRVIVCVGGYNDSNRGCDKKDVLLRRNTKDGSTVALSQHCLTEDAEVTELIDACKGSISKEYLNKRCYIDECVPKGSYQYGFATIHQCTEVANLAYQKYLLVEVKSGASTCERPAARKEEPKPHEEPSSWLRGDAFVYCSGIGCNVSHTNQPSLFHLTLLMGIVLLSFVRRLRRV